MGIFEDGTLRTSRSYATGPISTENGWELSDGPGVCSEPSALVRGLEKKWQCDDDVRFEVARIARGYKGSLRWREDTGGGVKCSKFVDDVLSEVFSGALGHHLERPPRIGGWRSKLARVLEVHTESPSLHDLGTRIRDGRNYPPLAGDWATRWIDIPMWTVVEEGPAAAQPGDIIGESIFYLDASGHVGIVVEPGQTASADSTAKPPGKTTVTDFGFRRNDDKREHGHSKDCVVRRFTCPDPPLWHS